MKDHPRLLDSVTFRLHGISENPEYGYTENYPIKVGGSATMEGPANERRYLNALTGPNGEELHYQRTGSLMVRKLNNSEEPALMIDRYAIWWKDAASFTALYFNMYEAEELCFLAPKGLRYKSTSSSSG